jgi:DNA polymerase III subunit beta
VKLTLSTQDLLSQLQNVTRVASTRSAVQALSGVLLRAAGGSCELMATDVEVSLQVSVPAEVSSEGSVVLPARLLLDVVRSLTNETLTLELRAAENDVEIVCGGATFHFRTLRAEDFPSLPRPVADGRISLPTQAFVDTVTKVSRSASHDETRPVLTGILVSASGQELVMVATDSYRLSVKRTTLDSAVSGSFEANVPARALQELARIAAGGGEERLSVGVQDGQVVFEVAGAVLSSRLIDGQFPNYRQLLPDAVEHELRLSAAELSGVVRRISLLAQKNSPLRLQFSEGQLTVSAQTPDVGEATESIPVPFQGEPFEIGFNADFLRDGLESVETDELVLRLISPVRPGLIESPDTSDFIYLIMPIRLTA